MRRRRQRHTAPGRVAALEALAVLGLAAGALAQPAAPVQTVVWSGFPPGGLGDQVARALLERLQGRWSLRAPVVPTQMALGVVASNHACFIGHGGLIAGDAVKRAFDEADAIVSVGCRWSSWLRDERGAMARRYRARGGPGLADGCAGRLRRWPHQLLEQRPDARAPRAYALSRPRYMPAGFWSAVRALCRTRQRRPSAA